MSEPDKKRKSDQIEPDEEKIEDSKVKRVGISETGVEDGQLQVEDALMPKEEEDALVVSGPILKDTIGFNLADQTLNVIVTTGGRVLMAMCDGGMQYLIAGARGNAYVKSGRHMYEVRVLETLNPADSVSVRGGGRLVVPKSLVRVGFSLPGSSLILGDGGCSVYFDVPCSQHCVAAVVLNLDPKGPNANTISLFQNGQRASEPHKLPEALIGKTLQPHISFRTTTLQVNFGPHPLMPLPFICRTLQAAAQGDVVVRPALLPKDGKYEVVLPVACPDEGTFDWLDTFLKKNPHFVEISDRKILEWAEKSGIPRGKSWKSSNDKPELNFGIPNMDDLSVRRVINAIVPVMPRNYVVMEVKQNLVLADRREALRRFIAQHFRRVAHVVVGEPPESYKIMIQERILKEKQERAAVEWMKKTEEEQRREQQPSPMWDSGDVRTKVEEKTDQIGHELVKGENNNSKIKNEKLQEREVEEKVGTADLTEKIDEPPKVELDEEELKMWFRPQEVPDLTTQVSNQFLGKFSIPTKDEGFDEIRFEWDNFTKSQEYLRRWVVEKKVTSRMDGLIPSDWFRSKIAVWLKVYADWQAKQKEAQGRDKKELKHEQKKDDGDDEKDDNKDKEDEDDLKVDGMDIFSVDDVCDIGNGEPLFINFSFEDWALLSLRYELHLLVHAFKRDVDDAERVGVHDTHLAFYYNRYYRKHLNPRYYGKESNAELIDLVKDIVIFDPKTNVLVSQLSEDTDALDIFVKLTEENRRERQRRIDAGDETVRFKFHVLMQQQQQLQHQQYQQALHFQAQSQYYQQKPQRQQVPWQGLPLGQGATSGTVGAGVVAAGSRPSGFFQPWPQAQGPWGGRGGNPPLARPRRPTQQYAPRQSHMQQQPSQQRWR